MRDSETAQVLAAVNETLREAMAARAHSTELAAKFGTLMVNQTLEVAAGVLDATGALGRDFRVPYAAVTVVNTTSATITVSNSAKMLAPGGPGAGSFTVPAGCAMTRRLVGSSVTFYGVAGGAFSYTVFATPQPEAFGGAAASPAVNASNSLRVVGPAATEADATANSLEPVAAAAHLFGLNGTSWDRLRTVAGVGTVSSTGRLSVHPGLSPFKSVDTATAVGAGVFGNYTVCHGVWSMHTVITGGPTAVTVVLEGSMDGVTWAPLATSTNVAGELLTVNKPVRFARANLTVLTGGTAPTVTAWLGTSG